MNPELLSLARNLLRSPDWVWLPGMLGVRDAEGFSDHLKPEVRIGGEKDAEMAQAFGSLPDLNDPATAGCLLHRLGSRWAVLVRDSERSVRLRGEGKRYEGSSLGEVCAKALLSSPL